MNIGPDTGIWRIIKSNQIKFIKQKDQNGH